MNKIAVAFSLMMVLSGCVNTSSPEFQKKTANQCASFGFQAGTPLHANCMMNVTLAQEQESRSRRQNFARALNESVNDMNGTIEANNQRSFDAMQRNADRRAYIQAHQQPLYRAPVTCTSDRTYGGKIKTVCE